MITGLYRLVARLSRAVCRHPEGIVCEHRQYEYDLWTRGYLDGLAAGKRNMEAKWRGNVTGEGPYAGYPPPVAPGLPSSFPVGSVSGSPKMPHAYNVREEEAP